MVVERPAQLTGSDVEPANVPGWHFLVPGLVGHRRSHDDDVAHDDRRRGDGVIDRCRAPRAWDADHEVDPAVRAEVAARFAGLGVHLHQISVAGAPHEPVLPPVGPVGEAPAAEPEHHRRDARCVARRVVGPERLAGRRVDGSGLIERRRNVDDVVDQQRGGLEAADPHVADVVRDLQVGVRALQFVQVEPPVDRLPGPGDLECADIVPVDLIEWGVLRAAGVAPEEAPLAALGAQLRGCRNDADRHDEQQDEDPAANTHGVPRVTPVRALSASPESPTSGRAASFFNGGLV